MSRHPGELKSFRRIIEPEVFVLHFFVFLVKILVGKRIGTMIAIAALEFSCVRFSDCVQR